MWLNVLCQWKDSSLKNHGVWHNRMRHAAAFHTHFPGLQVPVASFNQLVAHCTKQASCVISEILAVSLYCLPLSNYFYTWI